MYKPAPPRPKKTDIVRSRNGCKSCRTRRTKCDEQKPTCGTCMRLGKSCEYVQPAFKFQITTTEVSKLTSPPPPQSQSSSIHTENVVTQIPSNTLTKSLQTIERDVFYATYWEDRCLPALHPIFHSATLMTANNPILNDAILALSACNIGRFYSERKMHPTEPMELLSPSLIHQTRSQLFYSSAIKKLTAMQPSDYNQNPTIILTALILFAHLESAMGNFQGFYCHVQGMMNLLEGRREREGTGEGTITSLLTSWMQIRYVVWWARAYFSSLDIHQHLPSIPIPISLRKSPETLHERRVRVLSIMCESHRLNFKAVLQHFRHPASNPEESDRDLDAIYADSSFLLAQQAAILDDCLLHLPSSEQPIYLDGATNIHFHSHDAALNYAYYVVARIMQCTGVLQLLHSQSTALQDGREEDLWAQTLVQIAQGIDMQTCVTRNSYTIGFSGLLLAGILRCRILSIGLEIQHWLQTLSDLHPTEEGAFPVYQTLSVVKVINQLRMVGRDVFAVTQPVDDGGGNPKVTAYNSQSIRSLLFHGRYRGRDCLFEECITLGI